MHSPRQDVTLGLLSVSCHTPLADVCSAPRASQQGRVNKCKEASPHRPPTGFLGCLQARIANPLSAKQHGRLGHCCCCRDPAAAGFPTATVSLWCRVQAKRGADSHLCISCPKSQPLRLQKLFEMQLLGSPYAAPVLRGSVLPDGDPVKGTKSWETPNGPQSRGFVSSQGRIQPRQKRWKCSLLDLLLHRSHASPLPTSIGGLCHIIPNSNRSCKPHGTG